VGWGGSSREASSGAKDSQASAVNGRPPNCAAARMVTAAASSSPATADVAGQHGQQRDRQHAQDGKAGAEEQPGAAADHAGVPVPAVARRSGPGDRCAPGLVLVDAPAGQAQEGRDQGDRAGGGGDDAEDGGEPEQADVGDAGGVQAEQGDRDGARGDQDGAAVGG
jgi:hypothetical protein